MIYQLMISISDGYQILTPDASRFRYTLRLRSFPETTFQALALGKIPEWCLGAFFPKASYWSGWNIETENTIEILLIQYIK